MGKQAARCGDTVKTCNDPSDMPVSSIISAGTVMINKLPAAKQNDQVVGVDVHILMVPSPGGPVPTPFPHPYVGMLNLELSTTVKIMGMPAAVVGSKSQNQPPHVPCGPGPFQKPPTNLGEVMMGSTNVFIGDGSGGGGGGGGSAQQAQAQGAPQGEVEGHFLDVSFIDGGGFPITGAQFEVKDPDGHVSRGELTGRIRKTGLSEGDCEIKISALTRAAWSAKEARNGEKVRMQIEGVGIEDGTEVIFEVWQKDINRADKLVKTVSGITMQGGKAEAEWYDDAPETRATTTEKEGEAREADLPKGYSYPAFYFMAKVGSAAARSGILQCKDWIEFELKDRDGKAVGGAEYVVYLSNGEVRRGKLDGNGYAKIEDVPARNSRVEFPAYPDIKLQEYRG